MAEELEGEEMHIKDLTPDQLSHYDELLKAIALFEMIGGVFGVVSVGRTVARAWDYFLANPVFPIVCTFFLILYVLCFVAGLLLWRKHALGIVLSRIIQALQIPQFTIAGFLYLFVAGLDFTLTVGAARYNLGFSLGSRWYGALTPQSAPFSLGVNFVAAFIFAYLLKRRPKAPGIIYDSQTSLEWYVGPDKDTSWYEAKSWVENLTIGGGGWRMPTREELKGLHMNPAFKTTGWSVWSGEKKGSSAAWGFNFNNGNENWNTRSHSYYGGRGFAVRSRR